MIRVFAAPGGVPDTTPLHELSSGSWAHTRTNTGDTIGPFDVFRYQAPLSETLLAPGEYLLSIVNNTRSPAPDDWYWSTSNGNSALFERDLDGDPWFPINFDVAFILSIENSDTVCDNGLPDFDDAFHSDFDESNPAATVQVGDDFVLDRTETLSGFLFYGAYAFDNTPPASDNFTVRIFEFSAGIPNAIPLHEFAVGAADRSSTSTTIAGFDVYRHEVDIDDISLPADTYFLSIVNDTTGTTADWYWNTTGGANDSFERDSDVASWVAFGADRSLFTS